jgi:hypothetical protein
MIEQTPSDLTAQVIARAWKDEAFKQELLSNPRGVLERELAQLAPGATLPADIQIQVLEETPTTHYVVLPAKPPIELGDALSDADLQHLAAAGCGLGGIRSYQDENTYVSGDKCSRTV